MKTYVVTPLEGPLFAPKASPASNILLRKRLDTVESLSAGARGSKNLGKIFLVL